MKHISYYSDQYITDINNIKKESIGLYPNPVSDYLNFNFTNDVRSAVLEMFDMQGRKVLSENITNTNQLNMGALKNGVYIYIIRINSSLQNGTLIKE